MKMLSALCLVFAFLSACGGPIEPPAPTPQPPKASEVFPGDWLVHARIQVGGVWSVAQWGNVAATVSDDESTLRLTGVCPDGSGDISLAISGTYASGPVSVECSIQRENAAPMQALYRGAGVAYVAPGFLVVQLVGTGAVDGVQTDITVALVGQYIYQ